MPNCELAVHTVEKIGGTSISNTSAVLENVLVGGRQGSALYNRLFVVSAYSGMTDRLLEHKKTGKPGVYALFAGARSRSAWVEAIAEAHREMRRLNAEIFGGSSERQDADEFVNDRIEGVRGCLLNLQRISSYGYFRLEESLNAVREILAAQGEAHSAHNTVLLLKKLGVEAIFVDITGWRDETEMSLDARIGTALSEIDLGKQLPIVTGYSRCPSGLVRLYGRGYAEVTFARIAALTGAKEAIIHKEFHLSTADPKIVGIDRVRTVGHTNYDVANQLSNLELEAIHPAASKELRRANIPLRVKNTFDPRSDGTIITRDYISDTPRAEMVAGLRGVHALELFDPNMVGVNDYDADMLKTLKCYDVRVVTKASNANSITHYLAATPEAIAPLVEALQENFPTAAVATRTVGIVSVIGSALNPQNLTASAAQALADAYIEVLGVHQLMRNVDLIFIVDELRLDDAIRALHGALIEDSRLSSCSSAFR
ncbi:aspartate kinase [Mesorhizobium japonicum]|uniref:aspartate kinase n=1 Tax=Mesorhizobium japonicum TaxID=2066070 RepID=UPI0007FFEA14|nr:aspartate kinase [Mesorhizobium japonicum]MUT27205.1 aspartate kinase [Mesorhizobium japonicum]OBQ84936.1 aspartate kinase [Mesorhizobium sp. WSM3873]